MSRCLFCQGPLSRGRGADARYCGPTCRHDHWAFLLLYDFLVRRDPAVEQLAWYFFASIRRPGAPEVAQPPGAGS